MPEAPLTPAEAARWAARAGLPLAEDRHTPVALTAEVVHSVISLLRELDFGDTPPAFADEARAGDGARAGEERDAAL